jgi:hypothetical protein
MPAMPIRPAFIMPAEAARTGRHAEPSATQPAPLSPQVPPRVLQHGRAPAQLSFFFKRA